MAKADVRALKPLVELIDWGLAKMNAGVHLERLKTRCIEVLPGFCVLRRTPPRSIWFKQLWQCLYLFWHEARVGADFVPRFRLGRQALGIAAHELAKEKLEEMGAEVEVLAVLRVGKVEVVGYADAVFDDAVVEVKSGSRATDQQRVQALAYALALRRGQAFLVARDCVEKVGIKPHKIGEVAKRARFF